MDKDTITFLKLAIWREMRGRTPEEWRGVIWTIFNRVAEAATFKRGEDVLEVVTYPFQFTSMTTLGDPNTVLFPKKKALADYKAWQAISAYIDAGDFGADPTNKALLYESYPVPPWTNPIYAKKAPWATQKNLLATIGVVRFYREK